MADCQGELTDKLGIAAKEAKEILDSIRNYSGSADDRLRYAKAKADGLTRKAALRDFQAKRGAVAMADARTAIQKFRDAGVHDYYALKSALSGSDVPVEGARLSLHSAKLEAWKDVEGHLSQELRSIDKQIPAWVADRDFGREVARALWTIRSPGGETYKAPKTPWGPHVAKVAAALDRNKEALRQRLNDLGADIHEAREHVMPQTHDGWKMAKVGRDGWVNFIAPLLDTERTFKGREIKDVLGQIHDKITDLRWGTYTDERLSGPGGNLADRLGRSRELHFKSADDWMAYNDRFGTHENMIHGIVNDLRNKAESAAIIERFGTDPQAFYRKLKGGLDIKNWNEIPTSGLGKIAAAIGDRTVRSPVELLDQTFEAVTGADRVPGSVKMARFFSGIRSWLTMAHLGPSLFSQIPDLEVAGARASFNGRNHLSSYADQLAALARGRSKGEARDLAESAGVFAEGVLAHAHDRFSALDLPTGTMSKLSTRFMTWNGMKWWDDVMREGAGMAFSHFLAREVERGTTFDGLDEALRANLGRYGIGAKEWASVNASHLAEANGSRYLNPDALTPALGKQMRTYLASEAELSLPLPGPFERAIALAGTRPGTASGELRRMMMMYKLTAITQLTRVLPQVLQQGIPQTATFLAMSTALGYVSYAARELSQGRTLPDPMDGKNIKMSIARGGGLGILGDLFVDSARDMRRSLADVAGGPALGLASDAFRVYQHAANLKEDTAAQAFRVGVSNTPFVNLFYLKAAINYAFTWHIQEMMNPGYLFRMEQRIRREQGNQYFVPPSSIIKPGGGF